MALAATLVPAQAQRTVAPAPIDVGALRDETVRVMAEYLRIDTSNPPGNELATARWLQAFLAREGIPGEILDTAELGPGRANFYARLRGDGSGGKGIALVHHMDVVPASPELWSAPPFGGVVRDGWVWGRGALDMKGEGIIHLMAMVALKRAAVPLTRDIVLIANADEEVEGLGALTFVKRHRDRLADVEYVLTEGGKSLVERGQVRWLGVGVAEKRPYWVRLVAHGTPGHGSAPTPDNPVPRLARAVARLADWDTPVRLLPSVDRQLKAQARYETGERRAWLANAAAALKDARGRAWLLGDPYRNAILRNTVAPTMLAGSSNTNIIPAAATAQVDIRLLPDEDTAAFHRELTRVVGDTSITIEVLPGVTPPYNAAMNTPLFRAIERVVRDLLPGIPIATPLEAGASDRPTYSQAGLTAYGLDPYLIDVEEERRGVHGTDERLSIANIEFGLRLYLGVLREMQTH